MTGINSGILNDAYPLSAELIKQLEEQVLQDSSMYAYLDENSELCFSLPQGVDSIKELAWHNAYELSTEQGNFIKKAYKKNGLKTFYLDKTLQKSNIDDAWSEQPEEERLEGDGQEFYTLAPSTLSFRSSAPLNELKEVQINGQTVDPSNYTLEEGSTIVTFPIDYLQNFGEGKYEVTVESENKTVSGEFSVVDPETNNYGFYYNQPYVTEVEIPFDDAFSKVAFFLRENGTVDLIFVKYAVTMSGTFTCEGKNATMYLGDMVLTSVWSDDGKSIYNNEMQITAVLGSTEVAADSDFIYAYSEALGGYQVTPIDKTKSYYGLIKSNINNIPTVAIPDLAFWACASLRGIIIPSSVTIIGARAFHECRSLTSIVIPNSVESIGDYAFKTCNNLTSIEIPASVTSIGMEAFYNCDSLTSVVIPDSVMSIGSMAFGDCDNLTSIVISNSVPSIGSYMFSSCRNLTSIVIPDSVTEIGKYAFYNCDSLTHLTIGANSQLTLIDERAFYDCDALSRLDLPDSLLQIGEKAFQGCDALVDVTFGNSLETIGSSAFYDCTTLRAVRIPDSVTEVALDAFSHCSHLTEVVIGNSVTRMPNFYECDAVKRMIIGDAVTALDFDKSAALEEIVIGNSITSIPNGAFYGLTNLTSVVIGNSVESIGLEAFRDCTSLTNINIPDSVTSIGNLAFMGCSSLTNIVIPDSVTTAITAFVNCEKLYSISIPSTTFGNTTFKGLFNAYVGTESYKVPESLKRVTIRGGSSIDANAFYECTNITSIEIPDSVTSIEDSAFNSCYSLTSIEIPASVTSIGERAFIGCKSLTSITFKGTKAQWNAIPKGDSWSTAVPATYVQCTDGQVTFSQPK